MTETKETKLGWFNRIQVKLFTKKIKRKLKTYKEGGEQKDETKNRKKLIAIIEAWSNDINIETNEGKTITNADLINMPMLDLIELTEEIIKQANEVLRK